MKKIIIKGILGGIIIFGLILNPNLQPIAIAQSAPACSPSPSPSPSASSSPNPDVTIDVGPTFGCNDSGKVNGCVANIQAFPFDFVFGGMIPNSAECPHAEFFNYTFEACWVLTSWQLIEPAFLIAMFTKIIIAW